MAALIFDRRPGRRTRAARRRRGHAGIALENGRLRAELRARLQELQELPRSGSSRRAGRSGNGWNVTCTTAPSQRLVALSLELGLLGAAPGPTPSCRIRLLHAKDEVSASLEELRDVARGIYPAVLSGHGLEVALESLAARSPVPVQLTVDVADRPPAAVEVAAYYVVSEALTNIDKHSAATSVQVCVERRTGSWSVDVATTARVGRKRSPGSGLRPALADRVEALGGRLEVRPRRRRRRQVHAEIPCR